MQTEQKSKKYTCNQETKETVGWLAVAIASAASLVYLFTTNSTEESAETAKELLGRAKSKKSGSSTDAS